MTPEKETERLISILEGTFNTSIIAVIRSRAAYGGSYRKRRTIYFTDRIASKAERIKNLENKVLVGVARGDKLDGGMFQSLYHGIKEELGDIVVYALMAMARIASLEDADVATEVDHFIGYFDNPEENKQ